MFTKSIGNMKKTISIGKISIHIDVCVFKRKSEEEVKGSQRTKDSLEEAANKFIEAARLERRPSTVSNYLSALRSFQRFLGGRDISCHEVTAPLIRQYGKWLGDNGVCPNTQSCYMRSLRRVMKGCGIDTSTLFSNVFTGNARTVKRAAAARDIERLQRLQPKEGSFALLARDLFLFSFYALGMPFVDIAYLRPEQISDGYLTYHRRKTGQTIRVKIEPCMQQIIDRWSGAMRNRGTEKRGCKGSPYVFPLLSTTDPVEADRQRRQMLNRHNKALKKLGREAGVGCRLTSYTPRHSWATMAYSRSIELPVISQALGHNNPQTTLIYIRELDAQRLDKANHCVISTVSRGQHAIANTMRNAS